MLAERIKSRRLELNMTQKEVADKLNITYQTISKYERGVNIPDADMLLKLSNIFECTSDYLIGKTDNPHIHMYSHRDDKLGNITVGVKNYPKQLTPDEVHEMMETLKKYHFDVDAIIDDMRKAKEKPNKED